MIYQNKAEVAYGLFSDDNFTDSIKYYLKVQSQIISHTLSEFNTLVEVGCGKAENIYLAINMEKNYLGIDPVFEYIEKAKSICSQHGDVARAEVAYAEDLDQILSKNCLKISGLVVLPFNCFGNMSGYRLVCEELVKSKCNFLLFSYNVDPKTNLERLEYYRASNVGQVFSLMSEDGFRILSSEGLNSMAFNPHYLIELLPHGSRAYHFSDIGLLYTNLEIDLGINESLQDVDLTALTL